MTSQEARERFFGRDSIAPDPGSAARGHDRSPPAPLRPRHRPPLLGTARRRTQGRLVRRRHRFFFPATIIQTKSRSFSFGHAQWPTTCLQYPHQLLSKIGQYRPKPRIDRCIALRPLMAQSGHPDTLNQCPPLTQSGHSWVYIPVVCSALCHTW